jgi:hypothetical protein
MQVLFETPKLNREQSKSLMTNFGRVMLNCTVQECFLNVLFFEENHKLLFQDATTQLNGNINSLED